MARGTIKSSRRKLTNSDGSRPGAAKALSRHNLVRSIGGWVKRQAMCVVPVVVIASGNSTTGALLPPDRPVLNIGRAAVNPVDVVCTTIASQGTNKGTATAGVVGAKVLQDICLARARPRVYSEVAIATRVKGAREGNSAVNQVNMNTHELGRCR